MAYPYQISSAAYMGEPMYTPGPYEQNGNLYVVLQSVGAGSADYVHVYKSTDEGVTWAEQDSANKKNYYQSGSADANPIDTFRIGNLLYITYVPAGGTPGATAIDIAQFDMDTDTWGTVISGGPQPGDNLRFKSVVLSDGVTIRTVYTDLNAGSRWRVNVATYNGSSWGAGTILFDPGVDEAVTFDYSLMFVVLDADDNLGIACHNTDTNANRGTFRFRYYSAAGSAGDFVTTGVRTSYTNPTSRNGPSVEIPLESGVSAYAFAMLCHTNATGAAATYLDPGIIFVDPGSSPVSVRKEEVLATTRTTSPGNVPHASAIYVQSASSLFLYWADYDGVSQYRIRRACTKLLGWSSPADVFTPSAGDVINGVCAAVVNSTKVGIVFDARRVGVGETYEFPYYYQEALPTCSANTPTGTATGNINSVR